jgi:hypothetical protein
MIGFMDVIHVAEKPALRPAETMLNQMLDSSAAPTL